MAFESQGLKNFVFCFRERTGRYEVASVQANLPHEPDDRAVVEFVE